MLPFSSSVGERKLMTHFVVKFFFGCGSCRAGFIDLHSLRIAVRVLLALVAILATNSHLPLHLAQRIDVRNLSDCDFAGVAALAAGAVFEI